MDAQDNIAFSKTLTGVFEVYTRPAPSAEAKSVWWRILAPYSLAAVSQALGAYTRANPSYPPTPAAVLELLGQGSGDARPAADEAWAVALAGRDEADTVVWTAETAAAFAAARPVLEMGDEVGARMAFKGAYERLVAAARREGRAPAWQVSLGWDETRRVAPLERAVSAGLLPAPVAAQLLPAPKAEAPADSDAAAQIAKLRAMLADAVGGAERRRRAAEKAAETEHQRTEALKQQTAARVEAYLQGNA